MKFKIYPDQNLLVDVCTGSLKYEHLTELVLHEINDPNFGSVNRILSNIADASFEITAQELEEFAKMIGSPAAGTEPRWAILTSSPSQVVVSILLKGSPVFKNMIEVFSTLEACTEYLGVTFSAEQFNEDGFTEVPGA